MSTLAFGIRYHTIYITDLHKKTFQRVLRKLLFDILEKEYDFIQIPVIIKKKSVYVDICLIHFSAFLSCVLMYSCSSLRMTPQISLALTELLRFILFMLSCNLQGFVKYGFNDLTFAQKNKRINAVSIKVFSHTFHKSFERI